MTGRIRFRELNGKMIDESLLDDALSHRTPPLDPEASELVRLADLAGHLPFAGPDAAARVRMTTRFDDYITGRSRPGAAAWLAGWVGAGPRPRTAAQRLAAGGIILLAGASGASAATDQTPFAVATGVASFAENLVQNLGPRSEDAAVAVSTPTSISTTSPAATLTPTPSPTTPPTGTATPPAPPSAATTAPGAGQSPSNDGGGSEGHTPGQEPSATPIPTNSTATPATSGQRQGVYSAGDAGVVLLGYNDSSLSVLSVQANVGWHFAIRNASGQQIEVTFNNSDRRLTFDATLESGQPSVHVRTTLPAPESTRLPFPSVTRIPTATTTPSHEREDRTSRQEDSSGPSPTPVVSSP